MTPAAGTQSATVTLNVSAPTASGLTLSSSALTFNAVVGGTAPASQTLTVTAQTTTSATASASEQSCTTSNWLTLSPTGNFTAGTSNTNFTVSVNPSGLAAITTAPGTTPITPAARTPSSALTLNVPARRASGLPLFFFFNDTAPTEIEPLPHPHALPIPAQPTPSATASASEQSCTTSNWLTLSPTGNFTAGTSNTNFTVSVNQSGLA